METLSTIELSEIEYQDFVESADHYGSYWDIGLLEMIRIR